MTLVVYAWVCKACWKSNRPEDPACYRCKTPRDADDAEVEARRAAAEARATQPELVPDIVVALPVVIFRGYSRVWLPSGFFVLALLFLLVWSGVTDVGYLLFTGGLGVGLIGFGLVAGEVSDAMRNREVWAFVIGAGLSIVAALATVIAFDVFAPGLVNPAGIRVGSLVVFGGSGAAAIAGLVMMFTHRERGGVTTDLADLADIAPIQVIEGIRARRVEGDVITLAIAELDPGAVVPEHRHAHEQKRMVIAGPDDLPGGLG